MVTRPDGNEDFAFFNTLADGLLVTNVGIVIDWAHLVFPESVAFLFAALIISFATLTAARVSPLAGFFFYGYMLGPSYYIIKQYTVPHRIFLLEPLPSWVLPCRQGFLPPLRRCNVLHHQNAGDLGLQYCLLRFASPHRCPAPLGPQGPPKPQFSVTLAALTFA